jgi:hypothetical protein
MDAQRFDALTRALANRGSRRRFLSGLAAVVGIGGVGHGDAASCRSAGGICREHANCCSGVCFPPNRFGRKVCAKGLGEPATSGTECGSGIVADGVCCDEACGGQCEACNLSGAAGYCTPVSGAPVGGRAACGGSGDCAGFCDGANGATCTYPDASVICGDAVCDDQSGQATSHVCDGAGSCVENVTSCGLFLCGGSACQTSCGSDNDCIGAAYCRGGVCISDLGIGQSCDRRDQCQSGACVNGVCCSSASCPECQSCAAGGGACAADASQNSTVCSVGVCLNGACVCPTGQKLCGSTCIDAAACCTDTDCGAAAVCQGKVCNTTTHACEVVNVDTDPRCVSDACTTRLCNSGACNEIGVLEICGICEDFVRPCNPAVGPQCTPKVCNSPGPCQSGPGVCDPSKLGCVYTDLCADCQTCDTATNTCKDNCGTGVACAPTGVCNTTTNICDYPSTCGTCAYCDFFGTCNPFPDGSRPTDPSDIFATCCDGQRDFTCLGNGCPTQYIDKDGNTKNCCGVVIGNTCCLGKDVDGHCCPNSSVAVCTGPGAAGFQCCDVPCTCTGFGCFCTDDS